MARREDFRRIGLLVPSSSSVQGADPPRMSAFDPKRTLGWRMRDVALSAPKRSISLRLDDARASDCRFPGVPLQAAT
jgi:hypothetical protein